MRAVVITKHGGPGVLQVQERPDPELGPKDVRIAVAAAGINFADVMGRIGVYPDAPKPPFVAGYEVSGTILEIGADVEGFSHGQRVFSATQFGGYSSQVVVPASSVQALPDRLSFQQGAAIWVNYATAWAGLSLYGNVQPGERVLIHSAGGGVGIAATQLARRLGAEIYGTASPAKHARIKELGCHHTLDYTQPGWEQDLPPFDLIMDAVGGKSFRRDYRLLRAGGRLVAFGASGVVSGPRRNLFSALRTVAQMPRFNMIKQMSESKAVIGLNLLTLWKDHGTVEPWLGPLRALLDDGTIDPVVAAEFSFEDAGAAQTMITERRNVGKVVLIP